MKKIIFYFSISYIIIFSILTIHTLFNVKEAFNIVSDVSYTSKIENLKTKIDKIDDLECKNSLYDLLNFSEKTNFTGNVRLKEIYETLNENGFLTNKYINVNSACNLDKETLTMLNPYIVSSSLTYENLIQKYLFQYELNLNDKYGRLINETNSFNTELRMTKLQELDIISKIVEVQNEK